MLAFLPYRMRTIEPLLGVSAQLKSITSLFSLKKNLMHHFECFDDSV